MRRLRRAAAMAVCFTLGAAVVASPSVAAAQPSTGARPDVVNSASDARPRQYVPKDDKGRTLVYVEGAQEQELRAAVAKADGVVSVTTTGRVKAAVPGDKLDVVARQPGVTEVRLPDRAVPMGVTSEGVELSKARVWHQDGKKGAGVKVGIIDVGFGKLQDAQNNGDLPTGNRLVINDDNCISAETRTPHGTGVAEIVYDMAPEAALYLACIEDAAGFSAAEAWLRAQGVQIITAAVGFLSPTGGRGDGTGPADSPADVVKRSRAAGILWSVAAGNLARLHFAGKAVDSNGDSWVEFESSLQNNGFTLDPGRTATVGLRWDAWPTTKADLDIYVMAQPHAPSGPNDPDIVAVGSRSQKDSGAGLSPTEELSFRNTDSVLQQYYLYVKNNNAHFTTPFELFVSGPSSNGQLQTRTAAGSVTEPATSPYVIAVGATAPASGRIQDYSGRGPTIDGRLKPDITGFDQVSTSSIGQLQGTSASAAHVAGALALLKSAAPGIDPAQLQSALLSRTSPKTYDNNWGNGTLNLGPTSAPVVTSSGITVDPTPSRVHNTAYNVNDPNSRTQTLTFAGVPADTTAVAITVSARSALGTTIDVAPTVAALDSGKTTSLHVRGGDAWVSQTLFAPLGPDRSIRLRTKSNDAWVVVDSLGYFSPTQSTDLYFAKPQPQRIFDTRGFAGSARNTPLGREIQEIPLRGVAGVPANARSAVVNVTAFEATEQTYVSAYGGGTPGLTTLVVMPGERKSNLAVVPIDEAGKIRLGVQQSNGKVGVAVDVVGWFAPDSAGARYVALPEAARIADTATGNGLPKALIGHGQSASFQVGGVAGVSAAATTAALVMTGLDNNLGTELSVSASEVGWSPVTASSTRKTEAQANLVLTPLGDSGKVDVRNERGQTRLSADVTGYFVGGSKVTSGAAGNCRPPKDEPGFYSAFDGRLESDLEGWQSTGTKIRADGCELVTGHTNDVSWYSAHTYGNDYTLKVDWKTTSNSSDSGVFVLMVNPGTDTGSPTRSGYEIQIGATSETGNRQTGSIAGVQAPTATPPVKPVGEWNTYEIRVRWNTATVFLNGRQINEYTSGDATALGRNTYIGLQNDLNTSEVRFRNVRIKRDSPVRSGTLKNANGRCLDMKFSDPTQSVVWMWGCNNGFSQTWTTNDGAVLAGGRCLTASDITDGSAVVLNECTGADNQQWVLRTDGRLINRTSGRCVTPNGVGEGDQLAVRACDRSRSDQVWTVPNQSGRSGKVVGPGDRCLDVAGHDPTQNKAILWTCNGLTAQSWAAPGDGTLRGEGKCLDVSGANTANDSPVALWECNGHPAQQWLAQQDGTLVNPVSGRCLTTASAEDGATLKISNCAASELQMWRQTAEWLMHGPIVGVSNKCVDVWTNAPTSDTILYWDCNGGIGQNWSSTGTGAIRAWGRCLDIADTYDSAPVMLQNCRTATGQLWTQRHDGTLVNSWAAKCLDDRDSSAANGAVLQVFACHRGANQRWATPVNPS
ncbi:ricin-type beta-trefoil lectin domain protein [Lentzea rhizosphaerae]|uniref:Ricin-type beta-trefoil lectin domain protein n=1 Tax=Lentzea rhizosphaerae TaxID=2041025 RepID=A0ABV8C8C3_9PSEU